MARDICAVALAGGGSRGAYQAGVYQALQECGIEFQIVTGTSVGALNGAMMVQGDLGEMLTLWQRITAQDVANVDIDKAMMSPVAGAVYAEFLKKAVRSGGVDISGLEALMRAVVDEERFFRSPTDFGLVTVEYPSLHPVVMKKRDIPRGRLCDYLIASASCFPAFPVHQIGESRFIDGSYHDYLPINVAVELGATRVIAVDLEAVGLRQRPRIAPENLTMIRPSHPLGPFLMFEPDSARRNIRLGYLDALRAFGKAEGGWLTFRAGEIEALRQRLHPMLEQAAQLLGEPDGESLWRLLFERQLQQIRQREGDWFERAVLDLGEWYALDDEALYTADGFCYELLLRFNAGEAGGSAEIAEVLSRAGSAVQLAQQAAEFGHQRLVAHLYAGIRDFSYGHGERGALCRGAAVLQREAACAMLLFALKRTLAQEI